MLAELEWSTSTDISFLELKSREFVGSVKDLLYVDKKVIVVVHQKLQHAVTDEFRYKRTPSKLTYYLLTQLTQIT
jgi:nucleoside-triphosphatase THEP1